MQERDNGVKTIARNKLLFTYLYTADAIRLAFKIAYVERAVQRGHGNKTEKATKMHSFSSVCRVLVQLTIFLCSMWVYWTDLSTLAWGSCKSLTSLWGWNRIKKNQQGTTSSCYSKINKLSTISNFFWLLLPVLIAPFICYVWFNMSNNHIVIPNRQEQ